MDLNSCTRPVIYNNYHEDGIRDGLIALENEKQATACSRYHENFAFRVHNLSSTRVQSVRAKKLLVSRDRLTAGI